MFLAVKLVAQNEFIFWAELTSKNLILSYQKENISPTMTKNGSFFEEYVCDLNYKEADLNYLKKTELGLIDDEMPKNIKLRFLNEHKEELVECFVGAEIKIKDTITNSFLQAKSETYIKMLPLRFRVSFASHKALIYMLVKRK